MAASNFGKIETAQIYESEIKMDHLTPNCEKFLRGFWTEEELEEGLRNPIKFLKEVVNPYLKDLRKKGKEVPLVHLAGTKENPILDL